MIRYQCDRCGVSLGANDGRRYIARLEVFAAAGPIDLDVEAAERTERAMEVVIRQLADADPDEVEDQTYRQLRFDLCDECRRHVLCHPLG